MSSGIPLAGMGTGVRRGEGVGATAIVPMPPKRAATGLEDGQSRPSLRALVLEGVRGWRGGAASRVNAALGHVA